jgi:hypothetical protein
MYHRSICLGLSGACLALRVCAADGLHAPAADTVWPQWQVRIGLQTGHASPLSLSTGFGGSGPGLGQASAAWQNGLALTADLGLVTERLNTGNGRAVFGHEGRDKVPGDARLSPLLQMGVRYTF